MEKIEVCVRVRPLNKREQDRNESSAIRTPRSPDTLGGQEVTIEKPRPEARDPAHRQPLRFAFSTTRSPGNTFGSEILTPEIYEKLIKRVVKESLSGINGTVFAYGPTGSGKTFTMMGQKSALAAAEDLSQGKRSLARLERLLHEQIDLAHAFKSSFEQGDGLIMMAVRDLFRQIHLDSDRTFALSCSYLEIYNDSIYDLLNPLEKLEEELQITEINVPQAHPERVLHQRRN